MEFNENFAKIGRCMNELVGARLVMRGADGGVVDTPSKHLLIRFEADTGRVLIDAAALEADVGMSVVEALIAEGRLKVVHESLGGGTLFVGPPTKCYQCNVSENLTPTEVAV